jgi:coatomer protein complex subunit alpha (xenin)
VAFVARNRFAVFSKDSTSIGIYNLQNELSKKIEVPKPTESIFLGGNNRLLLKTEEGMSLFDLATRKVVGELPIPSSVGSGGVRRVIWSQKMDYVALISLHNVTIARGRDLAYCTSLHENIRVKSGTWEENNVFLFSTLSHVKYVLAPSGDSGIVECLPEGQQALYLLKASTKSKTLVYVGRDGRVTRSKLSCAEFMFKVSLHRRNYEEMKHWIMQGRMTGSVLIG